ncbi:MAG TPA: hypothetical protein VNW46_00200 [Gemmatimonadaceae bacterium]|jgi:hypothetical protein|nr:hypothetical protein [Gemmatimonadaceae bacterium]
MRDARVGEGEAVQNIVSALADGVVMVAIGAGWHHPAIEGALARSPEPASAAHLIRLGE